MPQPCNVVIFGASGDLTFRKLIPALYNLVVDGDLPAATNIVGFSLREKTDESWRAELKETTAKSSRTGLNEQVWSSFLGEEQPLLPSYDGQHSPFPAEQAWSAAVSINGGWDATVTVEVSDALARSMTTIMLAFDEGEPLEDSDVADAVGELVNMVGGNVKSLMPGPSALSLPAVAAGRAAHPTGALEVSRFDGVWAGQPVRVSVHIQPAT